MIHPLRNAKMVVLIFILLLCNCSFLMKETFLEDSIQKSDKIIPLVISELTIHDERHVVDSRDLQIPFLTWPGNHDSIAPKMTDEHKKLLQDEFLSCFVKADQSVVASISMTIGSKEFDASFFYEREYVKTSLRVDLYDGIHQPYLISATGESCFEVKSVDADNYYIERLYQKSLITSLRKAFESIRNGLSR